MKRARVAGLLVAALLGAAAIAACDRVVDLTPSPDSGVPDAANGNDGGDGGFGNDGGIDDGGGVQDGGGLPDAFIPDA